MRRPKTHLHLVQRDSTVTIIPRRLDFLGAPKDASARAADGGGGGMLVMVVVLLLLCGFLCIQ